MLYKSKIVYLLVSVLLSSYSVWLSAENTQRNDAADMNIILPSWKDGAVKQSIVKFLQQSRVQGQAHYIPVEQRIAVFDVDGTLWVEKPNYAQQDFIYAKKYQELQQAKATTEHELLDLSAKLFDGVADSQYQSWAKAFLLQESVHKRYQRPQGQLYYQPMRELIALFQQYQFKVFLCTGSDESFVRAVSEELFNVPKHQVIAQNVPYSFDEKKGLLTRGGKYRRPINLGPGKVSNLVNKLGQRPAIAVGNSLGDYDMLNWVQAAGGLSLLLVHDDAEREYDYGKKNLRIDQAFVGQHIVKVSMQKEFYRLFAFDTQNADDVSSQAIGATR